MNTDNTRQGLAALQQYFCDLAGQDICLAFSGGVDSSLLLKVAVDEMAKKGGRVIP